MATAEEKYLGRSGEFRSDNDREARVFIVREAESAADAVSAAYGAAEDTVTTDAGATLYIGPASWEEVAGGEDDLIYEVTIQYTSKERRQLDPGESRIRFGTTGGTAHYKQAFEEIAVKKAGGGDGPSFGGAIGATRDGVDGVDVVVGQFRFTVTHCYAAGEVPDLGIFYRLTGRTNDVAVTFTDSVTGISISLAEGEGLFEGAEGGEARADGNVEVTFSFQASPNLTGEQLPTIDPSTKAPQTITFDKKGFEYVWVRYVETDSDGADDVKTIVQVPKFVIVDRVYKSGDFGELEITA